MDNQNNYMITNTEQKTDKIILLNTDKLIPYEQQPFKVLMDESMNELCESIEHYGVLSPIIVRLKDNKYEILSGHRRIKACEILGLENVPVIVKNLDDDAAAILLVDSNLQRENILPSEKAFAYKLKMEALKHQGKTTLSQFGTKLRSDEFIASQTGESRNQIQRYIRLTNLIDSLLNLVDQNELSISAGVELSYLGTKQQSDVCDFIQKEVVAPSISQTVQIRKLAKDNKLNEFALKKVFFSKDNEKIKIVLHGDKIKKYFPKNYTKEQIEQTLIRLLEKWSRRKDKGSEKA